MHKRVSTKTTLGLIAALMACGVAHAQWEIGAKGGLSIPNLSAQGSENNPLNTGYSSRLGPDFSVFGELHLSKLFSLQGALEYSSQGGKKNGYQAFTTPAELAGYYQSQGMEAPPYLYADYRSEAKLDYLLIPLLAKLGWELGHESPWRFYVAAGPYLGLLVSAKQVTRGNSPVYQDAGGEQPLPVGPQSFDRTTDLKDQLHTTNFGVNGLIGLSLGLGASRSQHVFVEAGGNYGFLNIQKGTANGKNNTGAAVASLGYSYLLGGHGRKPAHP